MSEALLNNAQRLSKSFAKRSAEFEQARRLPADVSNAMAKAGIYRMFVPQSLGGSETSPLVSSQVFETLAQGDAACGWVAFMQLPVALWRASKLCGKNRCSPRQEQCWQGFARQAVKPVMTTYSTASGNGIHPKCIRVLAGRW